jgi:hypothetical protein
MPLGRLLSDKHSSNQTIQSVDPSKPNLSHNPQTVVRSDSNHRCQLHVHACHQNAAVQNAKHRSAHHSRSIASLTSSYQLPSQQLLCSCCRHLCAQLSAASAAGPSKCTAAGLQSAALAFARPVANQGSMCSSWILSSWAAASKGNQNMSEKCTRRLGSAIVCAARHGISPAKRAAAQQHTSHAELTHTQQQQHQQRAMCNGCSNYAPPSPARAASSVDSLHCPPALPVMLNIHNKGSTAGPTGTHTCIKWI